MLPLAPVWFGPLPPMKIWQIVKAVPPHPLKRGEDVPGLSLQLPLCKVFALGSSARLTAGT